MRQRGSRQLETLPAHLKQTPRLRIQIQGVALLPDLFDSLVQRIVEPDIVAKLGELGGELFIQLLYQRISIRPGHSEKDPGHPAQELAALLQRDQGIVKIRRRRIVDDCRNLLALAPNALIKSRAIMAICNQIKMRRLVRQQADV